jgi:prephenate dehydratase
VRAAYLGPDDGPAREAATRLLPDADHVAMADARALLDAVESGGVDAGVVPFEDSVAGSDPVVIDHLLFHTTRLLVTAEVDLAVPGADPAATRRYVAVRTDPIPVAVAPQTLLFVVPGFNRPGTLLEVLAAFSSRGINLTKVESRPLAGTIGMYGFLLEFEGAPADPVVRDALGDVLHASSAVKFLGTFSAADRAWGEVTGRPLSGQVLHTLADLDDLVAALP